MAKKYSICDSCEECAESGYLERKDGMRQAERWKERYEEVVDLIETNHRNPSKYRIEEHDMLNWVKANRKALNAGKMKPDRAGPFKRLLVLMEEYKRVNQYM